MTELGLVVIIVWRVVVVVNLVICLFVVVAAYKIQRFERHTEKILAHDVMQLLGHQWDQPGLPQPKTILERCVSRRKRERRREC